MVPPIAVIDSMALNIKSLDGKSLKKQVGQGKVIMEALIRWKGLKILQKDKGLHQGHDAKLTFPQSHNSAFWNESAITTEKVFVLPTGVPA